MAAKYGTLQGTKKNMSHQTGSWEIHRLNDWVGTRLAPTSYYSYEWSLNHLQRALYMGFTGLMSPLQNGPTEL